jgi:hypothetical protein
MKRLLTFVALGLVMAFAPTLGEAKLKRIHVTAEIVQQAFTGDFDNPKLGDQLISSVKLSDKQDIVGTGAGVCTIVSVPQPPADGETLLQCLLTAVFDKKGQLIFGGVAPLPQPGVVAQFGIMGGTDAFRKARGEALLTVLSPTLQDAVFDLD